VREDSVENGVSMVYPEDIFKAKALDSSRTIRIADTSLEQGRFDNLGIVGDFCSELERKRVSLAC
jgi:hypothetical protein